MATFIRPLRVDVIEGGSGFPWELLGGLAAAAAVALFVLAHLVVIAVGLAVAAVVTAGAVMGLRRYMVVGWAQHAPRPALPLTVTAELAGEHRQALGQPRQAIERGQHVHFHFATGMPAAEVAGIIRQAATPAAAAVEGRQS